MRTFVIKTRNHGYFNVGAEKVAAALKAFVNAHGTAHVRVSPRSMQVHTNVYGYGLVTFFDREDAESDRLRRALQRLKDLAGAKVEQNGKEIAFNLSASDVGQHLARAMSLSVLPQRALPKAA